jgi:hypothetical protein
MKRASSSSHLWPLLIFFGAGLVFLFPELLKTSIQGPNFAAPAAVANAPASQADCDALYDKYQGPIHDLEVKKRDTKALATGATATEAARIQQEVAKINGDITDVRTDAERARDDCYVSVANAETAQARAKGRPAAGAAASARPLEDRAASPRFAAAEEARPAHFTRASARASAGRLRHASRAKGARYASRFRGRHGDRLYAEVRRHGHRARARREAESVLIASAETLPATISVRSERSDYGPPRLAYGGDFKLLTAQEGGAVVTLPTVSAAVPAEHVQTVSWRAERPARASPRTSAVRRRATALRRRIVHTAQGPSEGAPALAIDGSGASTFSTATSGSSSGPAALRLRVSFDAPSAASSAASAPQGPALQPPEDPGRPGD